VKGHRTRMLEKMQARSISDLVEMVMRMGEKT